MASKQSVLYLVSTLLLVLCLPGCAVPTASPSLAAQSKGPCIGGPGGNIAGFTVNVKSARWADSIMPAQFENLPKAHLSMMGANAYHRPQANFMVIDLSIVNSTNAPLAWNNPGRYQFTYNLLSPQGTKYEYKQQESSILMKTGIGNQNPGIPTEGSVVFDVPKGSYTFTINQQRHTGLGRYVDTPVFQCLLN